MNLLKFRKLRNLEAGPFVDTVDLQAPSVRHKRFSIPLHLLPPHKVFGRRIGQ